MLLRRKKAFILSCCRGGVSNPLQEVIQVPVNSASGLVAKQRVKLEKGSDRAEQDLVNELLQLNETSPDRDRSSSGDCWESQARDTAEELPDLKPQRLLTSPETKTTSAPDPETTDARSDSHAMLEDLPKDARTEPGRDVLEPLSSSQSGTGTGSGKSLASISKQRQKTAKLQAEHDVLVMDANGDGLVDEAEFIAAGGTKEEFAMYDIDMSGTLEQAELQLRASERPKSEAQLYWQYRELMQRWKNQEQQTREDESNAPLPLAQSMVKPRVLEFQYEDLMPWTNERVFSLEKKLRAHEFIDTANEIKFFHDENGHPGAEMENELLGDLVEVENDSDVPELVVHVRSYIRVIVEPLSNPYCDLPQFSLIGNETIGEVKEMCFKHLCKRFDNGGNPLMPESVRLKDCQLHVNHDTLVDDKHSLFAVCDTFFEGHFDPMTDNVFFAMTFDKKESFILSPLFDTSIMMLIGINTVFMSIEHHNMSDDFLAMLFIAEWIFNVCYTFEFLIKVWFMKGFGHYLRIASNQFDVLIVISAWVNLFFEATGLNLTFVRVFRLLRALRVTRLLRKFDSVKKIIDATFNSLKPVLNIMCVTTTLETDDTCESHRRGISESQCVCRLFMMVVLIVFSCLGMQLYGSKFDDFDELPRQNFDNFIMAFLALFQVSFVYVYMRE